MVLRRSTGFYPIVQWRNEVNNSDQRHLQSGSLGVGITIRRFISVIPGA